MFTYLRTYTLPTFADSVQNALIKLVGLFHWTESDRVKLVLNSVIK